MLLYSIVFLFVCQNHKEFVNGGLYLSLCTTLPFVVSQKRESLVATRLHHFSLDCSKAEDVSVYNIERPKLTLRGFCLVKHSWQHTAQSAVYSVCEFKIILVFCRSIRINNFENYGIEIGFYTSFTKTCSVLLCVHSLPKG